MSVILKCDRCKEVIDHSEMAMFMRYGIDELKQFEDLYNKIIEGTTERIQMFAGVVIARRGSGIREAFTVRRVAFGIGVERVFPLHSPRIDHIEVDRRGRAPGRRWWSEGRSASAGTAAQSPGQPSEKTAHPPLHCP